MAWKILGFEKSPFTKTDISSLLGILPKFMTNNLDSVSFHQGNLPVNQYSLKGIDHARVRSLFLPGREKHKIIFANPTHESEHERFFYVARFLPGFLRVTSLAGLTAADQESKTRLSNLVSQALLVRPADRSTEAWRQALANRFCAQGYQIERAHALCGEAEHGLTDLDPDLDISGCAADLAAWHQEVIKRLARATARNMINSRVEDKHARANWYRLLTSDELNEYEKPYEDFKQLRDLLATGDPHRVAALNSLALALRNL